MRTLSLVLLLLGVLQCARTQDAGVAQEADSTSSAEVLQLKQKLEESIKSHQETVQQWEQAYKSLELSYTRQDAHATKLAGLIEEQQTAKEQATARLATLEAELAQAQAAVKSADAQIATIHSQLNSGKTQLAACQGATTTAQQQADAAVRQAEAALASAREELSHLKQQQQQCNQHIDALTAFKHLVADVSKRSKQVAADGAELATSLAQELRQGNTSRLALLAFQGQQWAAHTFKAVQDKAVSMISKTGAELHAELEKQAPGLTDKVHAVWSQGQAVLQEHVTNSPWAGKVVSQVRQSEGELRSLVARGLGSHPALAAWGQDPVAVQLVVYLVMGAPVALLLLFTLAACTRSKPASGASAGGQSRKPRKAKKATSGTPAKSDLAQQVKAASSKPLPSASKSSSTK